MVPELLNRYVMIVVLMIASDISKVSRSSQGISVNHGGQIHGPYNSRFETAIERENHSGIHPEDDQNDENLDASDAATFLSGVNSQLRDLNHALAQATWEFQLNGSAENRERLSQASEKFNNWYEETQEKALNYINTTALPRDIRRQLGIFTITALTRSKALARRQTDLQNSMEARYNAEVEKLTNKTTGLHQGENLLSIMATSRDPERLKRAWLNWRNAVGPPIRSLYREYVETLNLAANENGFSDYSAYWQQSLFPESPHLEGMLEHLWRKLRPLYLQLHAYIRRKLTVKYGAQVVGADGTIPAHLLGDMWSQHWTHINDIVSPYPDADDTSSVEAELRRRYTAIDMFLIAENFYTSLGFPEMTPQFWQKSHFVKSMLGDLDGSSVCQASAFDFYSAGDYRIKMCAKLSLSDLKTIHHEMGHIEYFMAYANQPTIYKAPPNAAFHESVGDIAQLSLLSDRGLEALGLAERRSGECPSCRGAGRLMSERIWRRKVNINRLLQMALDKLAFLPFGLLLDKWRWQVFQGKITPDNYNQKWWELRLQYQGIRAPAPRSEYDFDPAAKYHIPAHMPFASYFVAYIQEFQMYRALCDVSGHRGLLHECHLHGSREAGRQLRDVLKDGSSKPWREQLKSLTGSDVVTADAILEYFQPLRAWLERDNTHHRQTIGWNGALVNWDT